MSGRGAGLGPHGKSRVHPGIMAALPGPEGLPSLCGHHGGVGWKETGTFSTWNLPTGGRNVWRPSNHLPGHRPHRALAWGRGPFHVTWDTRNLASLTSA